MQQLEALARDAAALARATGEGARVIPIRPTTEAESEVARVLQICNACRYCEGYCAVFPAMTRRLEFAQADVQYLANLCHNCGACLHACQYAAPHEFDVNVPRAMARVRGQTQVDYAWPAALGVLYRRNGLTLALALAGGLALFLALAVVRQRSLSQGLSASDIAGNFYQVFPHNLMVWMFGPVFLFALLALAIGVRQFWKDTAIGAPSRAAIGEAVRDTLRLKYLDGGHGAGCNNEDDAFTLARRRFHHFAFYGFMLCFAATCTAALYHYLFGWQAPYGFGSLPKLLGTAGGASLMIGAAGLFWLNLKRDPLHGDAEQKQMDRGFMALLFLAALTGLLLMLFRSTSALAPLLAVHLGVVMALILTLPYGKFPHGIYHGAALLRWAIEKRQPNALTLGED